MVKRIKKRVEKRKVEEDVEVEEASVEMAEEAPSAPLPARELFKLEVKANAQNADQFESVMEKVFLGLADNGLILGLFLLVSIGVYGFIQWSESSTHSANAQERLQLDQANAQYRDATSEQQSYLRKKAKWYEDNPEVLTSPNFGEAPSTDGLIAAADRFKKINGELSGTGAKALASLGEASARFDLAQSAKDFAEVAARFSKIGQSASVELFARGVALQNAAVSFEQAATRATGEEMKTHWQSAAQSWESLGQLNIEVYGLFAAIRRAYALNSKGDNAEARKVLESTERAYESALKDPKNKSWNREIKLGLALFK
jgi:hypothetical protein